MMVVYNGASQTVSVHLCPIKMDDGWIDMLFESVLFGMLVNEPNPWLVHCPAVQPVQHHTTFVNLVFLVDVLEVERKAILAEGNLNIDIVAVIPVK